MKKGGSCEHGTLKVAVSYLIKATSKKQALEMANFQLNEHNVLLDQIRLVDDQGVKRAFIVEHIESVYWSDVRSSEYSNRFAVFGELILKVAVTASSAQDREGCRRASFRLPQSGIQDSAILILPTSREPAFTLVISQSLEWDSAAETAADSSLIKAG